MRLAGSQFPDQGLKLGHGNESTEASSPDHQEVPKVWISGHHVSKEVPQGTERVGRDQRRLTNIL